MTTQHPFAPDWKPRRSKLAEADRDLDDAIFAAERYGEDLVFEPEPYCDYCETVGHTFGQCPKRDDEEVPEAEL